MSVVLTVAATMGHVTAVASDYAWFMQRFPDLAEAYCLTLVRGLTPVELLTRVGLRAQPWQAVGVAQLMKPAYAGWDAHPGEVLFIGAASVDDWVLAVEPNGFLGATEQIIVPLSAGTRLVSHFRNVNAVDRFYWVEEGDIRVQFEPLFPARRWGSHPDDLVEAMRRVGFRLGDGEDASPQLHTEAAFALAEHLTGIRLTPAFLDEATYLCGTAPLPPG
jgi:Family of unknown function (DUF6461)